MRLRPAGQRAARSASLKGSRLCPASERNFPCNRLCSWLQVTRWVRSRCRQSQELRRCSRLLQGNALAPPSRQAAGQGAAARSLAVMAAAGMVLKAVTDSARSAQLRKQVSAASLQRVSAAVPRPASQTPQVPAERQRWRGEGERALAALQRCVGWQVGRAPHLLAACLMGAGLVALLALSRQPSSRGQSARRGVVGARGDKCAARHAESVAPRPERVPGEGKAVLAAPGDICPPEPRRALRAALRPGLVAHSRPLLCVALVMFRRA